jgi:hypothetical protein
MILPAYGLDQNDAILGIDIVEDPKSINTKLPLGKFIGPQRFPIPGFDQSFGIELLWDGIEDDRLLKLFEYFQVLDSVSADLNFERGH